jgi:hypothetical protein
LGRFATGFYRRKGACAFDFYRILAWGQFVSKEFVAKSVASH